MSSAKQGPMHRDPDWLRDKHHRERLTQTEMAELAGVSQPTIYQQLKKNGIETRHGYTNVEVLEDLKRVADELGRTPDSADYKTHGKYSHSTFIERFGRWWYAVDAAGLPWRD